MNNRSVKVWRTIFTNTLDLAWPSECVVCGLEGDWLCPVCQEQITKIKQPTCPFCNRLSPIGKTCDRCRRERALTGARSFCYYLGPTKTIIHQYKIRGVTAPTELLGSWLAPLVSELPLTGDWIITSVPMTASKLGRRGFNQAELLAKDVAEITQKPYRSLLKRNREGERQASLKRQDRFANTRDLFSVIPNKTLPKQVLIIDDIFTTGATLDACAFALKQAGVRSVWALTFAKD